MKKNLMTIAGLNLAANVLALVAILPSSRAAVNTASTIRNNQGSTNSQVNSASMTSIEKSFLEVPKMCKNRSAAFDPVFVGREAVSSQVLSIHHALDFAQGAAA